MRSGNQEHFLNHHNLILNQSSGLTDCRLCRASSVPVRQTVRHWENGFEFSRPGCRTPPHAARDGALGSREMRGPLRLRAHRYYVATHSTCDPTGRARMATSSIGAESRGGPPCERS